MVQYIVNLLISVFQPKPNGDELIVATDAGVKTLTPTSESKRAIIVSSAPMWIRFNAAPSTNNGIYYASQQGVELQSIEEIAQCQIYVGAAATIFVQYYR